MAESRRKNLRLKNWNYSGNAWYFITICCAARRKLFGEVVDERGVPLAQIDGRSDIHISSCRVELSSEGKCCQKILESMNKQGKQIRVEEFVIMPNHVHLIVSASQGLGLSASLSGFIRYLKREVISAIRKNASGAVVWQKGFYDHIIRDEADYERILKYMADNPIKWAHDKHFA